MDEEMIWLENVHRPPPPPPAPPSTPVVKPHSQTKAVSQKHHHHLLQQLPQRLANGVHLARPEDYMWLDPSGRTTSPPRSITPKDKAQSSRKVIPSYVEELIFLSFWSFPSFLSFFVNRNFNSRSDLKFIFSLVSYQDLLFGTIKERRAILFEKSNHPNDPHAMHAKRTKCSFNLQIGSSRVLIGKSSNADDGTSFLCHACWLLSAYFNPQEKKKVTD